MARKLTPSVVARIQARRRAGLTYAQLGREFDCSPETARTACLQAPKPPVMAAMPPGVPVDVARRLLERIVASPAAIIETADLNGEDPFECGERIAAILDDPSELARFAAQLRYEARS